MRSSLIPNIAIAAMLLLVGPGAQAADGEKMKYLVFGSGGPGFTSPGEALDVLDRGIIPTFDALLQMEENGKILGGGLPIGDRTFIFILEASSHAEVDELVRDLPAWGALNWKVTPLQSFKARADKERDVVKMLRGQNQ